MNERILNYFGLSAPAVVDDSETVMPSTAPPPQKVGMDPMIEDSDVRVLVANKSIASEDANAAPERQRPAPSSTIQAMAAALSDIRAVAPELIRSDEPEPLLEKVE